jgi:hypothetical protein
VDLARNKVPGTQVNAEALARATGVATPREICTALSRLVLGTELPEPNLRELVALAGNVTKAPTEEVTRQWLALLLAAPSFQWR